MALYLKIIDGPLRGTEFKLSSGQSIGRNQGDIILQDAKTSSLHAKIIANDSGDLIMVDVESRNGISIDGQKVPEARLIPGLVLKLGRTLLKVVDKKEVVLPPPTAPVEPILVKPGAITGARPKPPAVPSTTPPSSRAPAPPLPPEPTILIEKPKLEWNEELENFTQDSMLKIKDAPKIVASFDPPISLNFVRGLQSDTQWIIGYGPRQVGTKSFDLPIYEEGAPDICFELLPSAQGALFKTPYPNKVLINSQSLGTKILQDGDEISLCDDKSLIKVEFIK